MLPAICLVGMLCGSVLAILVAGRSDRSAMLEDSIGMGATYEYPAVTDGRLR